MSSYHLLQVGYKLDLLQMQIKFAVLDNKINKFLNFECPICMEPMQIYVNVKCGHFVCKDCYQKSINSINGNKCCICRQEIKLKNN